MQYLNAAQNVPRKVDGLGEILQITNVTITAGKIRHNTAKEVPPLIQYINAVRRQMERAVVSSLVILRRLSRLILDTVVVSFFSIPRHCRCTEREMCRKKQQA